MKINESWFIKPEIKNFPEADIAGGVVAKKWDGKVLIALIKEDEEDDYQLPKGSVEEGEDIEKASRREILEEAGISDLKLVKELGVFERLNKRKSCWLTEHLFLYITTQELLEQNLMSDEQYSVHWFEIDKLPNFFWPEQRQIIEENIEVIKKLIR